MFLILVVKYKPTTSGDQFKALQFNEVWIIAHCYNLKANNFDDIWYLFISSDLNVKTCLYLGLSKTYFMDVNNIDCALDIFDHACKSFLKKAWYARNELLT